MGIIAPMGSSEGLPKRKRPTRFDLFITLCHHGRVRNAEDFGAARYGLAIFVASLISPLVAKHFRSSHRFNNGNLASLTCVGLGRLWDEVRRRDMGRNPFVNLDQADRHFRSKVAQKLTADERVRLLEAGNIFGFIMMGRS